MFKQLLPCSPSEFSMLAFSAKREAYLVLDRSIGQIESLTWRWHKMKSHYSSSWGGHQDLIQILWQSIWKLSSHFTENKYVNLMLEPEEKSRDQWAMLMQPILVEIFQSVPKVVNWQMLPKSQVASTAKNDHGNKKNPKNITLLMYIWAVNACLPLLPPFAAAHGCTQEAFKC